MAYLLDTNVLSELRKGNRADANVLHWNSQLSPKDCFVSVVSFAEIKRGILSVRRKDHQFAEALADWYEGNLIPNFSKKALKVDLTISEKTADLMALRTRDLADALIAATAIVHGFTLVTRNENDFSDTGVKLINPWKFNQ